MFLHDWIPREERLPTEADADAFNCVIVYHVFNGVMITGWHRVADNRFISHWTHTPPDPPDIDPEYKNR